MPKRYGVFTESDAQLVSRAVRHVLSRRPPSVGQRAISADDSVGVTIDLAGVLHGPFTGDGLGKFVVVDLAAATCTQQAVGTVRPSVPPQNEVWIDLSQTVGRVYLPRVG